MTKLKLMSVRSGVSIGLLVVVALSVAGSSCLRRASLGTAEDVVVRRYRYNIDEDRNLVRVFGEVSNTGDGHVPAIVVKIVVRDRRYNKTGENIITLENIKPGERRTFSQTVTSHGGASKVECQVMEPADVE